MKYYLAYGSNLNLKTMKYRCKFSSIMGFYILKNYRLVYKGNHEGYLTIEKDLDREVPLGIFKVNFLDEKALDKYEGYPNFYEKKYLDIELNGKVVKAFIYVMKDNFAYSLPSRRYIKICEEGYKDFGFDTKILDRAYYDTIKRITSEENIEKLILRP